MDLVSILVFRPTKLEGATEIIEVGRTPVEFPMGLSILFIDPTATPNTFLSNSLADPAPC